MFLNKNEELVSVSVYMVFNHWVFCLNDQDLSKRYVPVCFCTYLSIEHIVMLPLVIDLDK